MPTKAPPAENFGEELTRAMMQLRRYALWLAKCPALADDLMQDALLNAWRAQDRFEPGTNLKAWCRAILRNVHISYMRRSWRTLPLPEEAMEAIPAEGSDSSIALDLLAVRNGIRLLPTEQREALLLVGAGGMSYHEAAATCGCAVGTMKSRVSRARARLTQLMAANEAGYNSDSRLRAGDALNDVIQQAASICTRSAANAEPLGAVLSESQRSQSPMLSKE
jgi:RNA polymerase sigma-70 factor (ECF subfamily)